MGGTGSSDVSWIGNTTSAYPNIAGGASAGNSPAFEFSVDTDAVHGHWIDLELAITASNWSGGPIEFSLPILCSATAADGFYLPLVIQMMAGAGLASLPLFLAKRSECPSEAI